MTISSENSRNDYVGNDTADAFPYTFKIQSKADLLVLETDADGVETELVVDAPTGGFTVYNAGEEAGGSITLSDGPLVTGHTLSLMRQIEILQETDLRVQGASFPDVVEDALDRLTMIIQQQQNELDATLRLPLSEAPTDLTFRTLPAVSQRASNLLGFDAEGKPVAVSAGLDIAIVSPFGETLIDDASSTEARQTLDVYSTAEVDSAIAAVQTDADAANAAIADLQTFDAAHRHTGGADGEQIPTAGLEDGAVTEVKLADDSVSTDKIQDEAVTTAKIDDEAVTVAKLAPEVIALMSPKTIQRSSGSVTFSSESGEKTANVTITSVSTGKTFVILNGMTGALTNSNVPQGEAQLTGATTVQIKVTAYGAGTTSGTITVHFTVVEFN